MRKEFLARADSITNMKETLMTILKLDGEINEKKAVLKSIDIKAIKKRARRYRRAVTRLDNIGDVYEEKKKQVSMKEES